MTTYLSVAAVIAIHDEIMERTGYIPAALRDEGLLESALMRVQTAAYYQGADLVQQAVLMAVGISQNQPFVHGNKRAAFAALDVLLRINGLQFSGDPLDLARQVERIAEREDERSALSDEFAAWLRQHLVPT